MKRIRKAVFPVAGWGTRFLPATKASPKEMIPLVDKPVIQYAVEEAAASGIETMIFVTGRGKRAIEDHFDASPELELFLQQKGKTEELDEVKKISSLATCVFVRQKEALGLGHAVLCAREAVGDEPFAVLLGDDVVDAEVPVLAQMMRVWERYQRPVIGLMRVPDNQVSRYGIAAGEEVEPGVFKVTTMVEKPPLEEAPSNLAIVGRYILTPDLFRKIEESGKGALGEIQLTDALVAAMEEKGVFGVVFEGRYLDCGTKVGWIKSQLYAALKHPEMSEEIRAYLRELVND